MIKQKQIIIFIFCLIFYSCELQTDYDKRFDFINQFRLGLITSEVNKYNFIEKFDSGTISPATTDFGTPTGKGAIVLKNWGIGNQIRDAMITLASCSITFDLNRNQFGKFLFFSIGMNSGGDGALGLIIIETGDGKDTVYQRFLNPTSNPNDRKWFDEVLNLTAYYDKNIKIIFATNPGPAGDAWYDWISWGNPILSFQTLQTPNNREVYVANNINIGGIKSDALVFTPGGKLTFKFDPDRSFDRLNFKVGMKDIKGDGAVGLVIVESNNKQDTIYNKYLNPINYPEHQTWIDETVIFSKYSYTSIKVSFVVVPSKINIYDTGYFVWGTPLLLYQR